MGAPKGNQWWKLRAKHGRDKLFASPAALLEACYEYFEWVEANPLWEYKVAQFQGDPVSMEVPKMRAMTISGLTVFLDIHEQSWRDWRKVDDFKDVVARVDSIIRTQKFEGAAADLFNASIIARDLGLADKTTQETTHKFDGLSDDELNARIKALEDEFKPKD
jgi:hypothetical protein